VKSILDPSVRKVSSSFRRVCSLSSVGTIHRLDVPTHGYVPALPRIGEAPALPGAESTTYRTKSSSFEHENPESSAEEANLGKLPSPARSRPGGRAPVVVGAWESYAQGEGGQ
jgi:hypothetical protein